MWIGENNGQKANYKWRSYQADRPLVYFCLVFKKNNFNKSSFGGTCLISSSSYSTVIVLRIFVGHKVGIFPLFSSENRHWVGALGWRNLPDGRILASQLAAPHQPMWMGPFPAAWTSGFSPPSVAGHVQSPICPVHSWRQACGPLEDAPPPYRSVGGGPAIHLWGSGTMPQWAYVSYASACAMPSFVWTFRPDRHWAHGFPHHSRICHILCFHGTNPH